MTPEDKDFFKTQFDKIYAGCLYLVALAFLFHTMHHSSDSSQVNQAWGMVTFFLGLISGLITGKIYADSKQAGTKIFTTKVEETVPPPSEPPSAH